MREDRDFEGVGPDDQLAELEARALDDRPVIKTGFPSLDRQLHRGGFQPGNMVLLGGRMHTRKTAVALNVVANLLRSDVPVGLLSLDESVAMYTSKLLSIVARKPSEWLEENWKPALKYRREYRELAANLTMSKGIRPTIPDLTAWLVEAEVERERPRVVVIDYTSLLVP